MSRSRFRFTARASLVARLLYLYNHMSASIQPLSTYSFSADLNLLGALRSLIPGLILVVFAGSCADRTNQGQEVSGTIVDDSLQLAIRTAMMQARAAVADLGVTEAGMNRIQGALKELAKAPGLTDLNVEDIHGGGVASAVLASDGDEDLTLILARFQGGATTPVHDHSAWAVACVVEGREHYKQWERIDDGSNKERAELRVSLDTILQQGDCIFWSDPPGDIHSQQALDGVAWELLLFGKNPLRGVELHYFDPETGRVTASKPRG